MAKILTDTSLYRSYAKVPHKALIFIIAVILCFFLSRWLSEGAYFRKDLVFITTPLENLYSQLQHSGESLLWAPELAGGYPLLANGQLGFWYPPHMILRQFLPAVWTLNLSLLLHALVGGIGMFYWLKHNKLHDVAITVGAILFPLGAVMVGKYESLNLILPFMWVPLLLWLLQLFLETGKHKYFFVWLLASVLSILVGHPQLAVYILLLEGVFVLCVTALAWRRWPRALLTLVGVGVIVGLTSFYWLPIIDVLEDTDRANGTLRPNAQGMFDNQFTPEAFLGLVIPHPFGHHETYSGPTSENELSSYYGPIALLAAAIGLLGWRRYPGLWLVSLVFGLLGLSLAVGGYSPLFSWLVSHGWTYFNFPARFFFYTHIGLVVLAALGVELSLKYIKQFPLQALVVLSVIIPALMVSWSWHEGVPWQFTKEPVFVSILRQQPGPTRVLAGAQLEGIMANENFGIKKWNPLCSKCRYRQDFVAPVDRLDGIAIKMNKVTDIDGAITFRLYAPDGQLLREVPHTSAEISSNDEWTNFMFEPLSNTLNQPYYFELTSTMNVEQAPRLLMHLNPVDQYDPTGRLYNCTSGECEPVRNADMAFKSIMNSERVVYYDALAPYVAAGFGLGSTQWSGSLPILKVKEYLSPFDTWGDAFRDGARTMMNRFGTTNVIGVFPPYRYLTTPGFTLMASEPYGDQVLRLYHNDEVFPRVHFAQAVKASVSSIDHVNLLTRTSLINRQTVLADVPEDRSFNVEHNELQLVKDERTNIDIQTKQAEDGFLVLRDVWLKGWNATIDNQPTTIYRVDGIFRGVLVPAGTHTVKFRYQPLWIKKAIRIESISVVILLALAAYSYWQSKRLVPK